MHGCGWESGAARERSSALAASVASRYELGADGVGAAPLRARARLHVPPPITRALPLLVSGGHVIDLVVEDVVRFALIETLGPSRPPPRANVNLVRTDCCGPAFDSIRQGGPTRTSADVSVPRLAGFYLIT